MGEGRAAAFQKLGFCPQVDPIWPEITGRDHLMFYGRLKGVNEDEIDSVVDNLLRRMGLSVEDGQKPASTYSGGMKRKLSVGIALIGHSALLFLDEPSAAVDAGAKRHLWKVIKKRAPDQTVVLTTHSMEEAEALCDRIAIQVKGQLRCLGTPSHIKTLYGSGYQLELVCRVPSDSYASGSFSTAPSKAVVEFVQKEVCEAACLLEYHSGRYLFKLPSTGADTNSLSLGRMFVALQEKKEEIALLDYSFLQPTLEQVFLRFAREQKEADEAFEEIGDA